jgi:hypothetical protein
MIVAMDTDKTAMERAFDLARSGTCVNVRDIVRHLNAEGYIGAQIEGPSLRKQLKELVEKAKKPNA